MNKSRYFSNTKEIKEKFADAAIVRMRLENFVTYDSLEFMPGANLNVIIGPNGTGKSTVVCAICLGMGGKPSVLGRAGNVCDYIKYGKNQATIEIELNSKIGSNHVIKRTIFKDNRSDWFLNEKSVKFKEVEELVSRLNIQVSNLCQFLPQEKVAEFARMNKVQLLESTERAVGGIRMSEIHNELIEKRKLARDFEKDLAQIKESLTRETQINARLDNQVASFMEMRKQEEELILLKRKKSCVLYKEKRDKYEQIKKEREKIAGKLNEIDELFEPIKNKHIDLDKKLNQYKTISSTKKQNINEGIRNINSLSIRLNETNDKLNDLKSEYLTKENDCKERKTKLENLKKSIEPLINELEEAKAELVNVEVKENVLRKEQEKLNKEMENLSTKNFELDQVISRSRNELNIIDRKIAEMRNVRNEKLNKLQQRANNAYLATNWLEQNKRLFKGNVYEPIVLYLNLKSQQFAKYVEHLIPFRDLTTMFLFERSDDMHLFLFEVRDKQNLVVNTALIPNYKLDSFQPPVSIDSLKKFGFKSYVREIIAAPDPILVYLCLYSNIHQVPIGDENTQRNISNILPNLQEFNRIYTNTHQYSFSKSRYTNKVSSSSVVISEPFWLTSAISASEVQDQEFKKSEIEQIIKQSETKKSLNAEERKKLETKILEIKKELINETSKRYRYNNLKLKVEKDKKAIENLEKENFDLIGDAKKIMKQIPEIAKRKSLLLNEFLLISRSLIQLNKDRVVNSYLETKLIFEKLKYDNEVREYQNKKIELEAEMEKMQQLFRLTKDAARDALQAASSETGVNLERGIPDDLKKKFSKLPDTIEKLDSEINQREIISQTGRDVDEATVKEYFERKREIERLQSELEKRQEKLENHTSNYENLKNEWLESIDEMIQNINVKFSILFQQLKCAGEISLDKPDNPEEFSDYGICIKVSFRKEEDLQELTAWQQSGGEKSVSTMMYMIALQEMTKCPFRVVDEINQGMDPVNERKVFDIIVQNSCSKQLAQYFLLTPKLLPDLSFDERTNVICVFNGPHNLPHSKYNLKQFIDSRKKLGK